MLNCIIYTKITRQRAISHLRLLFDKPRGNPLLCHQRLAIFLARSFWPPFRLATMRVVCRPQHFGVAKIAKEVPLKNGEIGNPNLRTDSPFLSHVVFGSKAKAFGNAEASSPDSLAQPSVAVANT